MAKKNTLEAKRVALALGILSGLCMLVMTLFAVISGWGSALINMLSSVYIGYDSSLLGALFGSIWGFVDGYVSGYLFVVIYNKLPKNI